jgi:hypothetical protein
MSTARATARARVRQDKTRILDTGSSKLRQNETRQHTTHKPIPIQDKIRLDKTKQIMARQKTRQDKTKQKSWKTKQNKARQDKDQIN